MSPYKIRFVLGFAILLMLFSCSGEVMENTPDFPENQRVADQIQRIAESVNPYDITYYYNTKRAQFYLRNTRLTTGEDYLSSLYWHGRELLHSGQTSASISLLTSILSGSYPLKTPLNPEYERFFKRLLGLSHMRLGEELNCLLNHTAESCFLPIQGSGVHVNQEGSAAAIAIFEELLQAESRLSADPEDLELIWLLNVAYQTLGRYPSEVPEAWLLPPAVFEDHSGFPRFRDVASSAGVATREIAGGSGMADFNRDGLIDLVTTSSGTKANDQIYIYINKGNGQFEDVTLQTGLMGITGGLNLNITDYNNDGYPDIYVMRGGWFGPYGQYPNSLLRNNGNGTFTDVSLEAGLNDRSPGQTAAWADFNRDGFLDLFVGFESIPGGGQGNEHPSRLYMNKGDGTFEETAADFGLHVNSYVKGVVAGDVNNDGWPDLYFSTLGGDNALFINQGLVEGGGLRFVDRAAEAGVRDPQDGFAAFFADVNQDGWEDLFVVNYETTPKSLSYDIAAEALGQSTGRAVPSLYINNGDLTFTNSTKAYGLDTPIFGMGLNFGDLDNDGWIDFYVGTGNPAYESLIPNRMFRNVEGRAFEEVSYSGGFASVQKGHGISWGDLDNDGDQDLYVNMGGANEGDVYQNLLFENPGGFPHSFINIKLEGIGSSSLPIGARLKMHLKMEDDSERILYRSLGTGASFGSNDTRMHFGLGPAKEILSLKITWPGPVSPSQQWERLPINSFITIREGASKWEKASLTTFAFSEASHAGPHHSH